MTAEREAMIELRDWLAQNATELDLEPYLGRYSVTGNDYLPYNRSAGLREEARYEYADAMLKARRAINDH